MHRFSLSLGFAILFSLLFSMQVLAQREVLPAGGDAQGGSGSFSWSIGQAADLHYSGSDGFISEGVQQPAEFFLTGADVLELPHLHLFPNPTTRRIQLLGLESIALPAFYRILNAMGQELLSGELLIQQPVISVVELPAGVYILLLPNAPESPSFTFVKH